jgi:hypothetical protein
MDAEFTQTQLDALTKDKEFQERIDNDEELTELWNTPPRSEEERFTHFLLTMGGDIDIAGIPVAAPTIGTLMLLGELGSPFVVQGKPMTENDVDVAVWVLTQGNESLDGCTCIEDVQQLAHKLCDGLDYGAAMIGIHELLAESFEANKRIARARAVEGGSRCRFNRQWYAEMTHTVASMTNLPVDQVGWDMPLALATEYALLWNMAHGTKVDRAPRDSGSVMDRCREMMRERIKEMEYK